MKYEPLTDIPWEPDALNRSASDIENISYTRTLVQLEGNK